mmetsp:Transcript_3639/g.5608  ORF Transcript_3639/g.5608 Transcript_3639/m.5608 type:complete len:156 (-) Transcript_3639:161-628(-)
MRLTISHRLDQVDPAEDILVLVWLIVSFCPTFATPISPFILVLLSTATSLPSNGELDALDVNTVEDLPTDRDDWPPQRRQPNVCYGIHGNGDGDGSSIAGASGDFNDPVGQHNNDQEGQNIRPGAYPCRAGRGTGVEPPFPDECFTAVVTFVILL